MNNWWQYNTSIRQGCVCMVTDRREVHMYEFLPFVLVPRIHFGKAEMAYCHRGLASYVSTWCSCTLQSYILPNISPGYYLQFRLRISMNYTENVAELLVHARTVDTRCSSPIFVKCLGMRLQWNPNPVIATYSAVICHWYIGFTCLIGTIAALTQHWSPSLWRHKELLLVTPICADRGGGDLLCWWQLLRLYGSQWQCQLYWSWPRTFLDLSALRFWGLLTMQI